MEALIELTVAIAQKFWNGLGEMNGQASFLLGVLLCFMVMRYLIRLGIIVVLVVISLAMAGTPVGFAALAQNFPSIAGWLGEDIVSVLEQNQLIGDTLKDLKAEVISDQGEDEQGQLQAEDLQAEDLQAEEADGKEGDEEDDRRQPVKKLK